jgi:hypothetical protein
MCGSSLSRAYPQYSSQKKKSENYNRSIVRGSVGNAAGYAYTVWQREMMRTIGMSILAIVFLAIPLSITMALWDRPVERIVLVSIDFLLIVGVFAGSCRVWLDAVRERRIEFWRAIVSGFRYYFHGLYVLLWSAVAAGITSGLLWLWLIPVRWLEAPDAIVSKGFATMIILTWFVVLLVIVLLPMYLWIILGSTLAMCRAMDRKNSLWAAPVWAIRKIHDYHWDLFKIGFGQIWAQIIGLVICYIGALATIPLSFITFTATYEWLRLHGRDSDNY